MISGAHTLMYTKSATKARRFFKDVLTLPSVDAGHGWLIFALPPSEIAFHPLSRGIKSGTCELYLMCKDIEKTMAALKKKGVEFTMPVSKQAWGLLTMIKVPGAGEVGLYQPKHPQPRRRK